MRILVTNDDGYDAEGLIAIAQALLARGHDVAIAAPDGDRSGSGSSIGTIEDGTRIPLTETTLPDLGPSVPVYALDCPPALAVLAACTGSFGPPPELVVSGINPGHNTGRSILFSSTVGALLTARVAGIGGIAISCGFPPHHRFDTAAQVGSAVVDWMIGADATKLVLNVNVPDTDLDNLHGVRATTLAARSMFSLQTTKADDAVVLSRHDRDSGFRPGTDSAAVADGYVSVTALRGISDDNDRLSAFDEDPLTQIANIYSSSAAPRSRPAVSKRS